MHRTAARFKQRFEKRHGYEPDVHEFSAGTETASRAAAAIGCAPGQVVKSIVMAVEGDLILVLTRGDRRVAEAELAAEFDVDPSRVGMADAKFVKDATGWSIGGVPPFCHETELPVVADPSFGSFEELWGAATFADGEPAESFAHRHGSFSFEQVLGATSTEPLSLREEDQVAQTAA